VKASRPPLAYHRPSLLAPACATTLRALATGIIWGESLPSKTRTTATHTFDRGAPGPGPSIAGSSGRRALRRLRHIHRSVSEELPGAGAGSRFPSEALSGHGPGRSVPGQ